MYHTLLLVEMNKLIRKKRGRKTAFCALFKQLKVYFLFCLSLHRYFLHKLNLHHPSICNGAKLRIDKNESKPIDIHMMPCEHLWMNFVHTVRHQTREIVRESQN